MIPKNLEMLMVLAGEDSATKPRSNKAVEIYNEYGRLPILLTGSHSGLYYLQLPSGIKPLSLQMRDYLLKNDVRDEDIAVETKSMDTFANFYYSLLEGLVKGNRIGIDTDPFHMKRSLWLAEKVFGNKDRFVSAASDWKAGISSIIQETIVRAALKHDLKKIKNGNFEELTEYMQHVHPFHALIYGNTPKQSWYGFLVKRAVKSKINLREKAEDFEKE